jgi:hypothetical protein
VSPCDRAQLLAVTELPVLVMELHFCFVLSVYLWQLSTYDHRSVKTGHPVRNHDVSIVLVVPGTKILEKKVL